MTDTLRAAAQAVVDRWDTPLWKDVPATAEYIGRLRASLAASAGSNEWSESGVADGWLHENGLLYRLTDERHPCNRDEINVTMADGSRSIESRSRRALELLDRIRATHHSPPEGMTAEQALRKVLAAVQRYMPPDGPSAQDTMSEIIAIVDPWPLEGMAGWENGGSND